MRIEEPIYAILNASLFAPFKSATAKLVSNAFLKAPSVSLYFQTVSLHIRMLVDVYRQLLCIYSRGTLLECSFLAFLLNNFS